MTLSESEIEAIPMITCYYCYNLAGFNTGEITGECEKRNLSPIENSCSTTCKLWEAQEIRLEYNKKYKILYSKYKKALKQTLIALNNKQLPLLLKNRLINKISDCSKWVNDKFSLS